MLGVGETGLREFVDANFAGSGEYVGDLAKALLNGLVVVDEFAEEGSRCLSHD